MVVGGVTLYGVLTPRLYSIPLASGVRTWSLNCTYNATHDCIVTYLKNVKNKGNRLSLKYTHPSSLQCQHLIPAPNAWSVWAYMYTTARPIDTQFLGHGCMDDLTTERSFDLQAMPAGTCMCLAYYLTCCP